MKQYGNAEEQAQEGCDQLSGIPELQGGVSRSTRIGVGERRRLMVLV